MANSKRAGKARRRKFPGALKLTVLCLMVVAAPLLLLWLLPAPPDTPSGGVTSVTRHVPQLRDSVEPFAKPSSQTPSRVPDIQPQVAVEEPVAAPQIPLNVTVAPEPVSPPPLPGRKPPADTSPQSPQQPIDEVRLQPQAAPGADLPSQSEIRDWVKSQAWEFLGGVDAQGNILYRFEVWLDAPPEKIKGIKSVSYDYDAPSATPRTRLSESAKGGFRARFGSLACAKVITIVVTMADGRRRNAEVDGCRALN